MLITPIILAGGTGTRLWPVSRQAMPKQFLPLTDTHSTFQATLERVGDPSIFAEPIVITNEDYRFHVRSQIEDINRTGSILLEPCARDSAPAIAAATGYARRRDGEDVIVLILAADHVVLDQDRFIEACQAGREAALAGQIVTFGIEPTAPKTGYGYIQPNESQANDVSTILAFVEKPDAKTAAKYIADGYLWNSGNFMVRADILRDEFTTYGPNVSEPVENALDNATDDMGFIRLGAEAFSQAQRISFDYCIMEKTNRATVVRARYRWSDIGSWDAIWEISDRDLSGNAVRGDAELIECTNCLVHSDHGITGLIGVDNLVISVTSDAVLVADRDHVGDVKKLVTQLEAQGRSEAAHHPLVRRPWGSYQSVDVGERFQVKRIVVRPGAALSLQRHVHRAEHWVVVRGVAEVTINDDVKRLTENQSTYIPQGAVHRLSNPGRIPVEIIEVQTGTYLAEDDIERLADNFGRR